MMLTIRLLPIEALMQEHRIIQQMIPPFSRMLNVKGTSKSVSDKFIQKTVDIMRVFLIVPIMERKKMYFSEDS